MNSESASTNAGVFICTLVFLRFNPIVMHPMLNECALFHVLPQVGIGYNSALYTRAHND